MKHFAKTLVSMFIATMVVAFNPATISTAVAADEKKKEQKTRRVPSMSEAIYKKLAEAQEAVDLKDYDLALEVLQEMLDRSRRYNGNEIGQVPERKLP
jgi:hypothetical protein